MFPACLAAIRSVSKDVPRTLSFISTALSLLLGFLAYHLGQGLDPVDSIYLTVVTISTVGYGDISPSTDGMRVFTCVYILIGSTYVFAQLANLFGGVLHAFSSLVKRATCDRFGRTDKVGDSMAGDASSFTMVPGRSLAKTKCSGTGRDLNGDGHADFIEPPAAVVYWVQELLPALLLLMLLQIASAGIFAHLLPEVSFATALYHCFITATTVGYGDVPITTRAAQCGTSGHTLTLPHPPYCTSHTRTIAHRRLCNRRRLCRPTPTHTAYLYVPSPLHTSARRYPGTPGPHAPPRTTSAPVCTRPHSAGKRRSSSRACTSWYRSRGSRWNLTLMSPIH